MAIVPDEKFKPLSNAYRDSINKKPIHQSPESTTENSPVKIMMEEFFNGDVKTVFNGVKNDALGSLKRGLHDLVVGGTDMVLDNLFKNSGAKTMSGSYLNRKEPGIPTTSYNSYYASSVDKFKTSASEDSCVRLSGNEFGFQTRDKADSIRVWLAKMIGTQGGWVTVGQLYQKVGFSSNYTDENYGWHSIEGFYVRWSKGYYVLIIPDPKPL